MSVGGHLNQLLMCLCSPPPQPTLEAKSAFSPAPQGQAPPRGLAVQKGVGCVKELGPPNPVPFPRPRPRPPAASPPQVSPQVPPSFSTSSPRSSPGSPGIPPPTTPLGSLLSSPPGFTPVLPTSSPHCFFSCRLRDEPERLGPEGKRHFWQREQKLQRP